MHLAVVRFGVEASLMRHICKDTVGNASNLYFRQKHTLYNKNDIIWIIYNEEGNEKLRNCLKYL